MTERNADDSQNIISTGTEQQASPETEEEQAFRRLITALEDRAKQKKHPANNDLHDYQFISVDSQECEANYLLRSNPNHVDQNGRILVTTIELMQLLPNPGGLQPTPALMHTWNILSTWGQTPEITIDEASVMSEAEHVETAKLINYASAEIETEIAQRKMLEQSLGSGNNNAIPYPSSGIN